MSDETTPPADAEAQEAADAAAAEAAAKADAEKAADDAAKAAGSKPTRGRRGKAAKASPRVEEAHGDELVVATGTFFVPGRRKIRRGQVLRGDDPIVTARSTLFHPAAPARVEED